MRKERIAISVDKEILHKVDTMVDGVRVRSRSHALDLLLRRSLNMQQITKAFIPVGAQGTGLQPYTYSTSKHLLKLKGKTLLERVFDWLKSFGVRDVTLATCYLAEQIEDYFGNGQQFDLNISYSREEEPLGTAGALWRARKDFTEPFLVINGDVLCNFNLLDMVRSHVETQDRNKVATVALKEVPNTYGLGVALVDGHKITRFVEKPRFNEIQSNLANAGVYILEPEIFQHLPRHGSLENEVFPRLAERNMMHSYIFSGPWIHIANQESLQKAKDLWF